jgi:3-hydroxyisobutyrate dehydrogenase-like beta-hydroxyacid dehydrogenase
VETVAVIGAGAMGAGVGRRLGEHGCTVLTLLDGRTEATRERAAASGMRESTLEEVATASVVLSIVPPAAAAAVVDLLLPVLADGPLFCDANAVGPDTTRHLADLVTGAGGRFVDGAIIGGPPAAGYAGPRVYVAGELAGEVARLRARGLDVRVLDGPVGAASALKMCYGGLNKGVIGLATAVLLAAERHGVADDLVAEMEDSMGWLLDRLPTAVPGMYPKAYRWDTEMHEIAGFLAPDDPAAARVWDGLGAFYTDRATAHEDGAELADLRRLLDRG